MAETGEPERRVPGRGVEPSSIDVTDDVEFDEAPPSINLFGFDIDEDDELEIPVASHSVDHVLALTGEEDAWDIDAHARSLKQAAGKRRPPAARVRGAPSISLPSPSDLASADAAQVNGTDADGPLEDSAFSMLGLARTAREGNATRGLGVPRPPPNQARGPRAAPPQEGVREGLGLAGLPDLLLARLEHLQSTDDRVGLARCRMELALTYELLGDDTRTDVELATVLTIQPDLALAHAVLRRRMHSSEALSAMLEHLEVELRAATTEAATIGLLAEKARLQHAHASFSASPHRGSDKASARKSWELLLSKRPNHGAALKGLEIELAGDLAGQLASQLGSQLGSQLAGQRTGEGGTPYRDILEHRARHLATMATAMGSQPELAAWLQVERADILGRQLGHSALARGALEQAVFLDPSVGPVRDTYVEHLATHNDSNTLVAMLDEEARLETQRSRSARLELDAGIIATYKLSDDLRAIALFERAAARAPTDANVDMRVLEELLMLYDRAGLDSDALRVRQARLAFLTDPAQVSYEERRLAALSEKVGDLEGAAHHLERARIFQPDDPTLLESLDRALALIEHHEARKQLWTEEAARALQPKLVAKHLCRAAKLAEALDDREEAIRHLESALLVAPTESEPVDELARLLAPAPSETADGESRKLIELYSVAMTRSVDPARRIAYLEKVALLWEDVIGDARRAAKAFEEILTIEPSRRSAILGLGRVATRAGDGRLQARALLAEAKLCSDEGEARDLRIRGATAIAPQDPSRALATVQEVLARDSGHHEARRLETRLHEDSGRWELASDSLRARIEHTHQRSEKVLLYLALSHIQCSALRANEDALVSLKAARALDPNHLVPPAEIARILTEQGRHGDLRQAYESLAVTAVTARERSLYLTRAAEILEFRSSDDAGAARLYQQALAETQDDTLVFERLQRVLARKSTFDQERDPQVDSGLRDRIALLSSRVERVSHAATRSAMLFQLAILTDLHGQEPARAVSILEAIQAESPSHIPALRRLEAIHRRNAAWSPLARVLSLQGDHFVDVRARLGALWDLANLEEWRLADQAGSDTYDRILELDSTDSGALEAILRTRFAPARRGEHTAVGSVVAALRAFSLYATDDSTRLLSEVQLALILEHFGEPEEPHVLREALDRYAVAVSIDRTSVSATTGLARLANRFGDLAAAVEAATSLAELSRQNPKVRARYLLDAANLLLSEGAADALGSVSIRGARAASCLEDALDGDPNCVAAAAALANLREESGEHATLVDSLRSAILRATSSDSIVMLGTEIAAVARDSLRDLPVAIEAMNRVRTAAPNHTPSLLTLSELYITARSWDLATEVLETVARSSGDAQARLIALFALARIYEKITHSLGDAERVLRCAVEVEPRGTRGIRALLHRLASKQSEVEESDQRPEIADLLERLSEGTRDSIEKSSILVELADMRLELSQMGPAERALIEAVAQAPEHGTAFSKLERVLRGDPSAYARALTQTIQRGRELGNSASQWFASLGHVEIEKLGRVREGIAHLRHAIRMTPTLFESRFELASALARLGANDEAGKTLMEMISPDARPLMSVSAPAAALDLLERTLNAERRPEEALVVSELRAIAGDLDETRQAWLRARRVPALEPHHVQLDRATLLNHVLPRTALHPLLDVAHAVVGLEAKLLRADLTDLGISSRDRVGRGHPVRLLLDRVARALSLGDIELVISPSVNRTRVLIQDEPWIVMPRKLTELPEPTQLATLARSVAKIALGVPWLEELPPPHIEAYLIACARQVAPQYAADSLDILSSRLVSQYEPTVAKALSRRQKKNLEELVPRLTKPEARTVPIETLTAALAQGEMRIAYLLTGDLLATVDELRGLDSTFLKETDTPGRVALSSVFAHGFAGDVCRFALTTEATALRRRLGTTWAG